MSITEIKKALVGTFQGMLKNIVSLANDSPLENNFKVLKVGDKSTPIELSENQVKINDLEANSLTLKKDLIISGLDVKINSLNILYLDGGGDTYIQEGAADELHIYVGGDRFLQLTESGDNGNEVNFRNACAGFTKETATFSTSGVIGDGNDSTDVDFRFSNKYHLTLTDNISGSSEYINMIFPACSGNFLLAVTQDGTGSRTVASAGWRAYDSVETLCNNSAGADGTDGQVRWAGGSAPTLTTGANKTDIISIFWDAGTQTAFCVPTLNF